MTIFIFLFSPHPSILTPTDIWTAFPWFPFTLCKYCLLVCSSWQEFSSSQCSHLESWDDEGLKAKKELNYFPYMLLAADPTLLKLIQLLISEIVIASVMSTDMQGQTMWACFTIPRDIMGEVFVWRKIGIRKNFIIALTKVRVTLLSLSTVQ